MFKWLKKRKVYGPSLDVDEVFIDSYKLSNRHLSWDHRLEFLVSTQPVRIFTSAILIVLAIFALRLTYLNTVQGGELSERAHENHIKTVWIKNPRGIIFDQNKIPLVSNESSFHSQNELGLSIRKLFTSLLRTTICS